MLDNFSESEGLRGLSSKLEVRFGEKYLAATCYSQLQNRKQKPDEDFPSLAADSQKLVSVVYPECPFTTQDKIASSQFIIAISDHSVKEVL